MSISLSGNLLDSAFSELVLSLEDRSQPVLRLKDNHYSFHAVGSIVLLLTGFDAWLNEGLVIIGPNIIGQKELEELARDNTWCRYSNIIKKLGGRGHLQPNNDLDWAIKLRHEIVHYLPRKDTYGTGPRKYLPRDLYALDKEELFLRSDDPKREIPFGQLVCSYHLAYWAWKTVDNAANKFISAFSDTDCPDLHVVYSDTSCNFKKYRTICSPKDLPTYDASHGLKLT